MAIPNELRDLQPQGMHLASFKKIFLHLVCISFYYLFFAAIAAIVKFNQ